MKYALAALNVLLLVWLTAVSHIVSMTDRCGAADQIRKLTEAGVINASTARIYLDQDGTHAEKLEVALADFITQRVGHITLILLPTVSVLLIDIAMCLYWRHEEQNEQRDPTIGTACRRP